MENNIEKIDIVTGLKDENFIVEEYEFIKGSAESIAAKEKIAIIAYKAKIENKRMIKRLSNHELVIIDIDSTYPRVKEIMDMFRRKDEQEQKSNSR